jgi:hypothetical protein
MNRFKSRTFFWFRYREAITRDVKTNINFGEYVRNLDQGNISGISTMIFNLEFVLFSPWYFYGFRFAPFAFADVGLISPSRFAFTDHSTYAAIGAGIRIRNESLAFKTIILSFGYIPRTSAGTPDYFYYFSMGDAPLVPILSVDHPYILRRDVILPF